jgi:hypothetical protein
VKDAVRVLLGDVGERVELVAREAAVRDLDPLHAGRVPHGVWAFGQVARWKIELLDFLSVVALAVGGRTNATFIVSVQVIRTFLMLAATPVIATWLASRDPRGQATERADATGDRAGTP